MRTILAGLALAAVPLLASANTGVAFVHGTSKHTNATDDYWGADMINSVRQGLPNQANYTVINCDFEQYMWDSRAAGCLATQLSSFISAKGITDMVVITHSNGGNVMRWIMSNPTYGNVFESALGWLLGYKNDAVRMQQVSWMAQYNANNLYGTAGRPALPKGFWSVVGRDVESAVWDGDSYCGGYTQQVGLEITQNWLASCSDGFLDCSSQAGAGTVWFYDTDRTNGDEPLSHNQSRKKCFGLDVILRNDV